MPWTSGADRSYGLAVMATAESWPSPPAASEMWRSAREDSPSQFAPCALAFAHEMRCAGGRPSQEAGRRVLPPPRTRGGTAVNWTWRAASVSHRRPS